MVEVLFLVPGNKYRNYGDVPPLGSLSVASYLQQKGISCKIIDQTVSKQETAASIKQYKPMIVCLEDTYISSTESRFDCFTIAKEVKKENPDILVVYQGDCATFASEDILFEIKDIDFIMRGESEHTLYEVVSAVRKEKSLSSISGLSVRKEKSIVHTPPRRKTKEIDITPLDYSLLDLEQYDPYCDCDPTKAVAMVATRGCWAKCSFCSPTQMWATTYGKRPVQQVVDEMEYLRNRLGIEGIKFQDLSLTLDQKYVTNLCNEIKKRDVDIKWSCRGRADVMSKEFLSLMKSAGCYKIAFGLESGSQRIQQMTNKGITRDMVQKAIQNMDGLGMWNKLFFIYGLPTETYQEALMTFRFVKKNKKSLHHVSASVGTIYPGTYMETFAKKNDLLPEGFSWAKPFYDQKVWDDFHTSPEVPRLFQPQLNYEQLKSLFCETNKRPITVDFLKEKIKDIGTEKGILHTSRNLYHSLKFSVQRKVIEAKA